MSVLAMGRVWDMDLPPNHKYVLLAMTDHADHEGRNMYPGVPLIARKTGYTERSIYTIIGELVESGHLCVQEAKPGRKTIYCLPTTGDKLSRVSKIKEPKSEEAAGSPRGDNLAPPEIPSPLNNLHPCKNFTPEIHGTDPCKNFSTTPEIHDIPPIPPYKEEPSINHPDNHPNAESLPTSAGERFEAFCREYPRRGDADVNIAGARKAHLKLFERSDQAMEIIEGATRFRKFAERTGIAGTRTVPMMTTWLEDRRWNNEYKIEVGPVQDQSLTVTKLEPESGVDYILYCPPGQESAQFYEPDKSGFFDALGWFEKRNLNPTRKWTSYCEQQRLAA